MEDVDIFLPTPLARHLMIFCEAPDLSHAELMGVGLLRVESAGFLLASSHTNSDILIETTFLAMTQM